MLKQRVGTSILAAGMRTRCILEKMDPKHPSAKEALDTKIHEALHLLIPEASEMMVRAYASRLTDFLWKDGYRRVEF
jgi:hypothetical protein